MDTKDLHTLLIENRDLLENILQKDIYRFQRYDIPFSIAIFHALDVNVAEIISKAVRETDEVVPINNDYIIVIFGFVNHESAYKAAENTLYKLVNEYPKKSFSAGLTSVTRMDSVKDLVLRAIRNLHYAMEEKESCVEDDSIIDFIVLH
jgi:GGDEF domain-containing protein